MTDYRKLFDLTGKTAVVLGAASGIGKSSAEALAGPGAHVVCADRDLERCEATAAGIRDAGGEAEAMTADAASAAEVSALAEAVKAKFPAPRHRRDDARTEYPQDHPRLHRGGPGPGRQPQHQGHGLFHPRVRPHHGGPARRQPDRLFLRARGHHRAGPRRLRRHQGGDRSCWSRALLPRSAASAYASTRSRRASPRPR